MRPFWWEEKTLKSTHKFIPWVVLAILILAALACSLTESEKMTVTEEDLTDISFQEDAVTDIVVPTWTLIPTITVVAEAMPTATQGEVVQTPTATEEQAPPEPTQSGPIIDHNPLDGAAAVYVPAGEFIMGSDDPAANLDERPEHEVYLDAYWIYQTTVTNRQYRQCILDEVCSGSLGRYPEDNFPAVNVTWFDAQDYCEWAGGSLPTEAQWEKAARGTDGRLFPWGNEMPTCEFANYKNCYGSKEIPAGELSLGASPYGALQMVGNVWEWVWDWYDSEYYWASPEANPPGPAVVEDEFRVQRGGSFESNPMDLYVTIRSRSGPGKADYRKSFRCVISE
jgi:eukaryotic-like serine/threonine-protein kinase